MLLVAGLLSLGFLEALAYIIGGPDADADAVAPPAAPAMVPATSRSLQDQQAPAAPQPVHR